MVETKDAAAAGTEALGTEIDRPEAYLAGDRRRAVAAGGTIPDRVSGGALFADISGFTTLTEALADKLGPQRGAEELTAHLNRVFHAVIDELDRYGGEVIYFSGDAITCWLDGDDGLRATACALAMQDVMRRVGEATTPSGTTVRLAMKVAVAVGAARRFVIGDPEIQLIDVLAGRLVDELAAAEQQAERDEVVLAASAMEALGARVQLAEQRPGDNGRSYGVVASLATGADTFPAVPSDGPLPDELVRQWVLPAVYERLRTGRGEFLAELRPAFPLFVGFRGIDYDEDDAAMDKLDDFVRRAQRILTAYGGNPLQLTLGDKGAYLFAVFGAPVAHEDDAARAAAASLELRNLDAVTAAKQIQIGITHGRLRCGTYGHAMRRTFGCLGDAVNLSARLMSAAPPGSVYAAELVRNGAGDAFEWEQLTPMKVKGKTEPVEAFSLVRARHRLARRHLRHELPIVGREPEMAEIGSRLEHAIAGEGSVVGIVADAGLGKSRLVAEIVRGVRRRGVLVAFGDCQAFGTNMSYSPWQEVWRVLLDVNESLPEDEQVHSVERGLERFDPSLVPRAPLLGGVLGLPMPDNELTAAFDAKLRKTSLEDMLASCLRARAAEEPLVLVLEDCQWLDPLSRDLLEVLARAAAGQPVLAILAYRPGAELGLERLPHFAELPLAELAPTEAGHVIRAKLEQLMAAKLEPPAALVQLITERSQGNPFYIEELLNYVRGQDVDLHDEAALRKLQLPESLHSLVLSRVDTLGEAPRRTLKVASVVGRFFLAPALPGAYSELGSLDDVRGHLAELRGLDLVQIDREQDEAWLFKHMVTQEVAYESMPFALRSMLHGRVGAYIEATEADAIDRHLDLLAHHYWLSGNEPKKREYLARAGEAAQGEYANAAALDYYERLVQLLADGERVDVMLKMGKVLELVGEWQRAEEINREALALAEALGDGVRRAWCETALGEVARKQGRYEEAGERLDRAAAMFEKMDQDEGVGQVLHLAGTLAAQRGDYEAARARYEASMEIRERLGEKAALAGLLSNLGVLAEYSGDYDGSRMFHERALALRKELADRWAIAVSLTNLGMIAVLQGRHEEAREHFGESMRLNREVGDSWMVAICHNNIGNAARGLGDFDAARSHYADSLRAYSEWEDRWALAFLLEDVGLLAALEGELDRALELVGAADRLRKEVGSPRAPALEAELDARLTEASVALDEGERKAARERGRTFDLPAATEAALAFCTAEITTARPR